MARLDFDPSNVQWAATLTAAAAAATLFTLVAWITRLHDGRAPLGSLDETIRLGAVTLIVGMIIYFFNLLIIPDVAAVGAVDRHPVRDRGDGLGAGVGPGDQGERIPGGTCPARAAGAGDRCRLRRSTVDPVDAQRPDLTVVSGRVARRRPAQPASTDRRRARRRDHCRPACALPRRSDVSTVVVAIPSANAAFLRRVSAMAADARLSVKVLPGHQ